jgi:hypothetical protein
MNPEEAVVRAFILPVRQERYLEFLKSSKKEKKFTSLRPHFNHLNPKFVIGIPGNQQSLSSILKLLLDKGASSTCWVISEDSELDGQEMELQTALKKTIGYQVGTFISCVPGKLAYFENEGGRYILPR